MRVLIRPLEISIGMQCQTCLSNDKRLVLYEKHYQKSLKISVILRTIAYSLKWPRYAQFDATLPAHSLGSKCC